MPLLKSLVCLKGDDNGRRFLIISLVCYLLLIILSPFLNDTAALVILLFVVSTPVLAGTALRRINDAGFAAPLAIIPVLVYWLNLFGISYIEHGSRWTLLVLATITTLAMATISNARIRRNYQYEMGYHGPVDLQKEVPITIHRDRIEPTIAGHKAADSHVDLSQNTANKTASQDTQAENHKTNQIQDSWEQQLGKWIHANQKASAIGLIGLFLLTLLIALIPSAESPTVIDIAEEKQVIETVKSRLNKIEMPDQFWVMLDQNEALTIAWEGDIKSESALGENGSYWSAATAKGDKDCTDLHFSLGEDLRTLQVTVKNGGDYYADFSPVDTAVIINSIADKDRFKLCGYEFTLKGTRSLLRQNRKYSEYFDS